MTAKKASVASEFDSKYFMARMDAQSNQINNLIALMSKDNKEIAHTSPVEVPVTKKAAPQEVPQAKGREITSAPVKSVTERTPALIGVVLENGDIQLTIPSNKFPGEVKFENAKSFSLTHKRGNMYTTAIEGAVQIGDKALMAQVSFWVNKS